MRIVLIVGAVIAGLIAVVLIIGWMLPVAHRASREALYPVPPSAVYSAITNLAEFPAWRPAVQRVELLADEQGERRFREIGKDGNILFGVESAMPEQRLVIRIADPSLPFGGRWTYEIVPAGSQTRLRITEDGEVRNPVFRFVSRFVLGHNATIDRYLGDLGRKFGQPVTITDASGT